MRLLYARILLTSLLAAAVAACGTSQPTKYYLLSAGAADTPALSPRQELTIGVGPIILPPYLERREMVSRTSSNELNVAVYHQWGESLGDNVSRVIANELARILATERIISLPLKRSLRKALQIDYQVTVAINQFERNAQGVVVLDARWAILDNDRKELMLQRAVYTQAPLGSDYASQAAAQSRLLGRLNGTIASEIVKLAATAAP